MSTKRNPSTRRSVGARFKMLAALLALLGALGGMAASGGGSKAATPAAERVGKPTKVSKPEPEPVVVVEPISEPEPEPVVVVEPIFEPEPTPFVDEPSPEPTADEPTPVVVELAPEPAPFVDEPSPEPDPVVVEPTGPSTFATFNATATAGRVETLELDNAGNLVDVKILSGPAYGNVTVNPDNTLALVLTGTTETTDLSFSFQATYADGTSTVFDAGIDVSAGSQAGGWGVGEFYMLETDQDNHVIVEHGENHTKVHVSGSDKALSLNDIAALEGLDVSKINGRWLEDHPEYGSSPEMALAQDSGEILWERLTGGDRPPSSDWLLFERGYEYNDMDRIIEAGTVGESELNPIYFGAYGEGDKPVLNTVFNAYQEHNANVVVQGLELGKAVKILTSSENILFDDASIHGEVNVQNSDGFTLHNSTIYDVFHESTKGNNPDEWSQAVDRVSGIFIKSSEGILISDTLFDHNGWAEGYDYNLSTDYGQPPSFYSHNVYLQYNNLDVTFRDNITMRGASFGAQIRSGGFIEDNVFLDNNAAVNFLGGDYKDRGHEGEYTLFTDNVVTSAAYKTVDVAEGALSVGIVNQGEQSTLKDNIVAHLADPNNSSELDYKYLNQTSLNHTDTTVEYDNTIVYNWIASKGLGNDNFDRLNINTDGLNYDLLDQTTIQIFAAQILGKDTATIGELADHLRAQADGLLDSVVDADLIIDFFQTSFGLSPDIRSGAETLRFVPNDLGDGVRWDNRLNWNTEDLPGTQDGDSVDLGGNWVNYGGTTTLDNLDMGDGGKLGVTNGYLEIEGDLTVGGTGGTLDIDGAGQVWLGGYSDDDLLEINVDGGRFANTGLFDGAVKMNITDNAQVILGTDDDTFALTGNSTLTIEGDDAKVGFDGEVGGTSVLQLTDKSTLSFIADPDGLGEIREFYSGHFDTPQDGSGIQSGVNLGGADLHIDISTLAGGTAISETLITVDEIIGSFDNIVITGLGETQDAKVWYDYDQDTVTLTLSEMGSGTGQVSTVDAGVDTNAQANVDLWAALTNGHGTFTEEGPQDALLEDPGDAFIL